MVYTLKKQSGCSVSDDHVETIVTYQASLTLIMEVMLMAS